MLNEAIAELGDPCITSEINQFRSNAELQDTLNKMLRETQKRVTNINKDLTNVEEVLRTS